MGIIFNTKGMVAEQKNIISEAGNYVLKIVKIEQDGYDSNSNPKVKISFEGKKVVDGKLSQELYTMMDWYTTEEKLSWKIARLRDSLKAPEVFDFDDLLNRYVVAVVEMNTYNNKTNPQFKSLSYSKLNDNLPPIPEAKQGSNESQGVDVPADVPEVDVIESEIPF